MDRNKKFGYLPYILSSLLGSMTLLILMIGAVEIVNASPSSTWQYEIVAPSVLGRYPAAALKGAEPGDWDQLVFTPRAGELVTVTQNVTLTVPPVVFSTVVYQPSEVGQNLHQSLQVWKSGQLVKSFSWPVTVREPSPPENGSNLSCDPNSASSSPGDIIFCQLPPTTSLQAVVQAAIAQARGVSIDAVPVSEITITSVQWTSGSQNILKVRAASEDPTFARLRRADTPVMATLNTGSGSSYVLQEGERGQWQVFVPLTQR